MDILHICLMGTMHLGSPPSCLSLLFHLNLGELQNEENTHTLNDPLELVTNDIIYGSKRHEVDSKKKNIRHITFLVRTVASLLHRHLYIKHSSYFLFSTRQINEWMSCLSTLVLWWLLPIWSCYVLKVIQTNLLNK